MPFNCFSDFVSLVSKDYRLWFFICVEDVRKTIVNQWEELEWKLLDKERVIAQLEAEKKISWKKKLRSLK